jgi:hypothetical protein
LLGHWEWDIDRIRRDKPAVIFENRTALKAGRYNGKKGARPIGSGQVYGVKSRRSFSR